MSKAVSLGNDNYLDSTSIVHNKKKLSSILNKILTVGSMQCDNLNELYASIGKGIHIFNLELTGERIGAPAGAYEYGMMIMIARSRYWNVVSRYANLHN